MRTGFLPISYRFQPMLNRPSADCGAMEPPQPADPTEMTGVMSRRHRVSGRTLALVLAVAATTTIAPADAATRPRPVGAQVIHVTAQNGFDWGVAGIGAAGGVGVSMLAVGGGLLIAGARRNRQGSAPRP
jgi:hypothetical protein